MKGFVAACIVTAGKHQSSVLERPIHFSFTYDEEIGCLGAQELVEDLRRRPIKPALAIIGEPTSMRVIEGHKGCYEYTTHFRGAEGHGSEPDKGVNAIEFANRYIGHLYETAEGLKKRAPQDSPFDPPWTTVQVGRIEGGSARNVIAGQCSVEWEMRPVQQSDAKRVHESLQELVHEDLLPRMRLKHAEADIHLETIAEVCGFDPMKENEARDLVSSLTGSNQADVVAFGTEAGLFQSLGMDVVVCGPGSIEQAHKADEFITYDQLQQCLDMLDGVWKKCQSR